MGKTMGSIPLRLIASWRLLALAISLLCPCQAWGQSFGSSTSDSNVGYIDSAWVGNLVRFRVDAAFGNDRPDRAEFFYAKCGCFRATGDPNAPGPPLAESKVNYQTLEADVQFLLNDRFAAFLETPVRLIQPEQNVDAGGFGDLQTGFKFAFWACEHCEVTFQLRTYIPTGNASLGLGTDHVSLEPALLWSQKLPENWVLEGEFRDWIPIGGSTAAGTGLENKTSSFDGNILRYGLGIGYNANVDCKLRITPIFELVGWTLLGGISDRLAGPISDETGTTIVNAKIGVRLTHTCGESFYVGYGRALTRDVWYTDTLRVEYRYSF